MNLPLGEVMLFFVKEFRISPEAKHSTAQQLLVQELKI
jgi:hypothetical protein